MVDRGLRFAACMPHPVERLGPVSLGDAAALVAEATWDDVPVLATRQTRARGGSAGEWADPSIGRSVVTAVSWSPLKVSGEAVGYTNVAFLPEHPMDHAPAGYYLPVVR